MIEQIRGRLERELMPSALELQDRSANHAGHMGNVSGGGHFTALIVSDAFTGLSLVDRHRKVYSILGGWMGREIHAFSMTTLTAKEHAELSRRH